MITSRDYLVAKGLAGKRGRLNPEAKRALAEAVSNGEQFSDLQPRSVKMPFEKKEKPKAEIVTPQSVRNRDQTTVWAIDKSTKSGGRDTIIAFDTCAACSKSIQYCIHDIPQLPRWIGGGDALMTKPQL